MIFKSASTGDCFIKDAWKNMGRKHPEMFPASQKVVAKVSEACGHHLSILCILISSKNPSEAMVSQEVNHHFKR